MDKTSYKSIEEFCEILNGTIERIHNDNYVSVVAHYDEARFIIQELIYYGYILNSIDLDNPDWREYVNEYEIYVIDGEIYCEKLRRENGYYNSSASIVFFLDDVSSKVINSFKDASLMYEVHLEDDEDDCECDDCDHYDSCHLKEIEKNGYNLKEDADEDGTHGFTLSKTDENGYSSYSFYSTELDYIHEALEDLRNLFKI